MTPPPWISDSDAPAELVDGYAEDRMSDRESELDADGGARAYERMLDRPWGDA